MGAKASKRVALVGACQAGGTPGGRARPPSTVESDSASEDEESETLAEAARDRSAAALQETRRARRSRARQGPAGPYLWSLLGWLAPHVSHA